MRMVYVPAGEFEMGSQVDQWAQPVHTVALNAFWIDQTEVTNAMFSDFLNQEGNQVEEGVRWLEPGAGHRGIVYGHIEEVDGVFRPETGYEDHPVIEGSWYGAAAYCAWAGARLPTEAEWEYAYRSGTNTAFYSGDLTDMDCDDPNMDAIGWYCGNATESRPIGSRQPNAWGLHDMHGNAAEWTLTAEAAYPYREDDGRNAAPPASAKRCKKAPRLMPSLGAGGV